MPKYRLLTSEELKGLEKEFIDYLVVNGIAAEDWEKMKEKDIASAEKIINLFSDVVFEKILRNTSHLEKYEKSYVRSFCFNEEEVEMITMESEHPDTNFTDPTFIQQSMQNPPEDLLIYKSEKPYDKSREQEIFALIEMGCLVSNGNLHKTLTTALG